MPCACTASIRSCQSCDDIGAFNCKPLCDHAADRQADEHRVLHVECIANRLCIADHLSHAVRPVGHLRFSVSAQVVADDAQPVRQQWHDFLPQIQSGPQRVCKYKCRGQFVVDPVEPRMELHPVIVGLDFTHRQKYPAQEKIKPRFWFPTRGFHLLPDPSLARDAEQPSRRSQNAIRAPVSTKTMSVAVRVAKLHGSE